MDREESNPIFEIVRDLLMEIYQSEKSFCSPLITGDEMIQDSGLVRVVWD
jgi:hypothetical protein